MERKGDTKSSTFHAGERRTNRVIALGQIECDGPWQIRACAMLELASLIARHARYRPHAAAVVFEGERLTHPQLWARVTPVGNMLRSLGIGGRHRPIKPARRRTTLVGQCCAMREVRDATRNG
jgi:non-ribosomal peptide synthetase component F